MEMKTAYLCIKEDDDFLSYFPIVFKNEIAASEWCKENAEYKYTECKREV